MRRELKFSDFIFQFKNDKIKIRFLVVISCLFTKENYVRIYIKIKYILCFYILFVYPDFHVYKNFTLHCINHANIL